MRTTSILIAEISGLLIIFALFLLILGYFKIITLPNFLLQSIPSTAIRTNSEIVNNNPNSVPVSFTKLTNQASDAQIKKYANQASGFSKPTAQTNPNDYVSDAVFSGYNINTIQVVTKDGVLNLNYDQTTLFQKQPDPKTITNNATQSGALPKAIAYVSPEDFFSHVVFGSVLQVSFSKPNLKVTQINYIESIKPIL